MGTLAAGLPTPHDALPGGLSPASTPGWAGGKGLTHWLLTPLFPAGPSSRGLNSPQAQWGRGPWRPAEDRATQQRRRGGARSPGAPSLSAAPPPRCRFVYLPSAPSVHTLPGVLRRRGPCSLFTKGRATALRSRTGLVRPQADSAVQTWLTASRSALLPDPGDCVSLLTKHASWEDWTA